MYQSFLTHIHSELRVYAHDKVLLAVSGGVDSMVMAHLFVRAGYRIGVAHVNYGLRDEDAGMDQSLVEQWASAHSVPFHLYKVDREEYSREGSVQMIARDLRYTFFEQLRAGEGYDVVATAHNLNDNIETVLFALAKGCGLRGLTGIPSQAAYVIRPMLFASKEEIYHYAEANHVSWREDRTNAEDKYSRNLIRNQVVPLLRKINPSLEKTLGRSIQRFKGAASSIANQARQLVQREENGTIYVQLGLLPEGESALSLLEEVLNPYEASIFVVLDLHRAIQAGESGKLFSTPTFDINLDRSQLIIRRKSDTLGELLIESSHEQGKLGESIYTWQIRPVGEKYDFRKPGCAYLDADLVSWPMKVRQWRQGDVFLPYGMNGKKKKVSDLMIDLKIPVLLKSRVQVVESAGEIAWVVGYRVDHRFRITDNTRSVLQLEVQPDHV